MMWQQSCARDSRRRTCRRELDVCRPVEVTSDGRDLRVVFRYGRHAELFAVRFSLVRMPEGPQTGETCQSLEDWAEEVAWVLDEELNTAMAETAERTVTQDGLVHLRWRNSSGVC